MSWRPSSAIGRRRGGRDERRRDAIRPAWHLGMPRTTLLDRARRGRRRRAPEPAGRARSTGAFYVVAAAELAARPAVRRPGPDPWQSGRRPSGRSTSTSRMDLAGRGGSCWRRAPSAPVPFGDRVIGAGPVVRHRRGGRQPRRRPGAGRTRSSTPRPTPAPTPSSSRPSTRPRSPPRARRRPPTSGVPVAAAADQREMLAAARPARSTPGRRSSATPRERGIVFLSTPFDDGSADLLDRLDVPAFKVGLRRADQPPVPRPPRAAAAGPLLLSTGMADMVEVAAAVDVVRAAGDPPLALLPLRVELPGGRRRREPAGHRDDAPRLRRPGRLVRPHAGHRGRPSRPWRSGADARREAPHPRSGSARAGPRGVARADEFASLVAADPRRARRRLATASSGRSPPSASRPRSPDAACTGARTSPAGRSIEADDAGRPPARRPGWRPPGWPSAGRPADRAAGGRGRRWSMPTDLEAAS